MNDSEKNDKARQESSDLVRVTEDSLNLIQSNLNRLMREYKIGEELNPPFEGTVARTISNLREYLHNCSAEISIKYPAIVRESLPPQ